MVRLRSPTQGIGNFIYYLKVFDLFMLQLKTLYKKMNNTNTIQNYCFCTLALGYRYQLMARKLAQDLMQYAPLVQIMIGTDNPRQFQDCDNVIAFRHNQTGTLHCFNDKRFVIEKALGKFNTVVYLDADTRIVGYIPEQIDFSPGITGYTRHMIKHLKKYRPQHIDLIQKVADKLAINTSEVEWIGESLFAITRDNNKEKKFIENWGLIANYLELRGFHGGEGSILGLSATKVGWKVHNPENLIVIDNMREHLDASKNKVKSYFWQTQKNRLGYHYRLNKTRLIALKKFNFYYL